MSRFYRVSLVTLSLLVCASAALANVPSPENSSVPDAIVLSPGIRYTGNPIGLYVLTARTGANAVIPNGFVEIEISPAADGIVAWCSDFGSPSPPQARGLITGTTDVNGVASFQFYGGGCLDPADFNGASYIAQVRVNGIVLEEPFINSPDVVNALGKKATDTPPPDGVKRCDQKCLLHPPFTCPPGEFTMVSQVSLSDAVFHTRPIKLGQRELCSKFTPPFTASVALADAVALTPYVKNNNFCRCQ
jgi:hypothetical protein